MLDGMPTSDTPHLSRDLPPDLPKYQIERAQRIVAQVLTYLRAQSQRLPPDADLAVTYNLQPEADQ